MTRERPTIHRGYAPPAGDTQKDPWPGDLATGFPIWGILRFDGQVWRYVIDGEKS